MMSNFNGGIDTHCSRMRQAAGSALRRANTKNEEGRNGWKSIMQLTTKIHRDYFTYPFSS